MDGNKAKITPDAALWHLNHLETIVKPSTGEIDPDEISTVILYLAVVMYGKAVNLQVLGPPIVEDGWRDCKSPQGDVHRLYIQKRTLEVV